MDDCSSSWMTYPISLPAEHCNPYAVDLTSYSRLLEDDAERLFVEDADSRIKIIEANQEDCVLSGLKEFENQLNCTQLAAPGRARIILVPQRFSWDHLLISRTGFLKLASRLKIFPAFLDVVQAFGLQTSSKSDSVANYKSQVHGSITECSYLIKSAEKHGRDDSSDPWSIRQMGVYHQRDDVHNADTFVILNPSSTFQKRLRFAQTLLSAFPTWQDIHTLVLSCSTTNWKDYVSYLESQAIRLKTKAHLSSVSEKQDASLLKVNIEDTQDVQVIHDKLHNINHVLNANQQVAQKVEFLLATPVNPSAGQWAFKNQEPSAFVTDMETQAQRVKALFPRIEAASGLMQNVIAFSGLEVLKANSAISSRMAELAQHDNRLMIDLSTKSREDAQTLKTITILTMVYLPAAFVSQFLSMGYVDMDYENHRLALHFASEMWIFGVLTILLLAVTIGTWLWLDSRRRRRSSQTKTNRCDCETGGGGEKG